MTPRDAEQRLIERVRVERLIRRQIEALEPIARYSHVARQQWDAAAQIEALRRLLELVEQGEHHGG